MQALLDAVKYGADDVGNSLESDSDVLVVGSKGFRVRARAKARGRVRTRRRRRRAVRRKRRRRRFYGRRRRRRRRRRAVRRKRRRSRRTIRVRGKGGRRTRRVRRRPPVRRRRRRTISIRGKGGRRVSVRRRGRRRLIVRGKGGRRTRRRRRTLRISRRRRRRPVRRRRKVRKIRRRPRLPMRKPKVFHFRPSAHIWRKATHSSPRKELHAARPLSQYDHYRYIKASIARLKAKVRAGHAARQPNGRMQRYIVLWKQRNMLRADDRVDKFFKYCDQTNRNDEDRGTRDGDNNIQLGSPVDAAEELGDDELLARVAALAVQSDADLEDHGITMGGPDAHALLNEVDSGDDVEEVRPAGSGVPGDVLVVTGKGGRRHRHRVRFGGRVRHRVRHRRRRHVRRRRTVRRTMSVRGKGGRRIVRHRVRRRRPTRRRRLVVRGKGGRRVRRRRPTRRRRLVVRGKGGRRVRRRRRLVVRGKGGRRVRRRRPPIRIRRRRITKANPFYWKVKDAEKEEREEHAYRRKVRKIRQRVEGHEYHRDKRDERVRKRKSYPEDFIKQLPKLSRKAWKCVERAVNRVQEKYPHDKSYRGCLALNPTVSGKYTHERPSWKQGRRDANHVLKCMEYAKYKHRLKNGEHLKNRKLSRMQIAHARAMESVMRSTVNARARKEFRKFVDFYIHNYSGKDGIPSAAMKGLPHKLAYTGGQLNDYSKDRYNPTPGLKDPAPHLHRDAPEPIDGAAIAEQAERGVPPPKPGQDPPALGRIG